MQTKGSSLGKRRFDIFHRAEIKVDGVQGSVISLANGDGRRDGHLRDRLQKGWVIVDSVSSACRMVEVRLVGRTSISVLISVGIEYYGMDEIVDSCCCRTFGSALRG